MARKARSVAPTPAPMPLVEPFGRRRSPTLAYVFGGIYLLMLAGGFAIGMAAGTAKSSARKTVAVAETKKTTKGRPDNPPDETALLVKPKEPARKEEPKSIGTKDPEPAPMPEPKTEHKMEKPEPKPEAKMEKSEPEPKPVAKTEPKSPAKTEPKKGPTALVTFSKVFPVFRDKCVNCHGGAEPKGGLDMRDAKATMKSGDSGAGVVAGDPDNSLIWQRIQDKEMPMPPKNKPQLTADEKKLIKDWIAGGAK